MENGEPKEVICFAGFELNTAHRRLLYEGKSIALNAKAFDLLVFLAENVGRVVTKDEILDTVWQGQFVEEANLTVQMSALRKALGEKKDAPRFLVTIPGKGYKFVAQIQSGNDEVIIEKHKISRIVVEDEKETLKPTKIKQLTERKTLNHWSIYTFAGLVLLFLIGFVGFKYFYQTAPAKTPINSLAVLPFVNQNNDANTEYLSDGLADSLTYSLSELPGLRVMSRSSAFRYKGKEADAKTIGGELNVQAILTGRVIQFGDKLTVSTELVSTGDNSVIWGGQFTRQISDVGKLETDIAQAISQKLQFKLSGADEKRLQKNQTESPEAYQLYLLGRYHLNKLTDDGFRKGLDYFQKAIEKDPNYALAHAGLADAYQTLSGFDVLSPHEGFPKARAEALKALELDENLAEAHKILGIVKCFYDWNWAEAEREFRRAIEINPSYSDAHEMYAYYLSAMGRFDESLQEIEQARQLDPLSISKITGAGEILRYARKYDQAIEQNRKALELDENSGLAHWTLGNSLVNKGLYEQAITEYQKAIPLSGNSPDEPASLAYTYALSGRKQEAQQIINNLKQRSEQGYVSPTVIAFIYGGLGDKDQAFAWLDKAANGRDFILVFLKVDPTFDPLRFDPRFTELLQRVGLQ